MLLRLPKIGMEMTEAVFARWLVDDGAVVAKDQPLYEFETDKAEQQIDAPVAGTLRHIAVVGAVCRVGDPVAEILEA